MPPQIRTPPHRERPYTPDGAQYVCYVTMQSARQATPPAPDTGLQERIHRLWDELAGFEAARSEVALMHLLGAVRMTDDERDPLRGWRPRLIRYLRPLPNDEKFTQQKLRSIRRGGRGHGGAGPTRRHLSRVPAERSRLPRVVQERDVPGIS